MENLTQFTKEKKDKQINVIMGLDFGTSSSKVVLQVPEQSKAYPVIFDNGYPNKKFLMPTLPYFDREGNIQLAAISGNIPLRELKMKLLDRDDAQLEFVTELELETTAEILTVAYLAKVIRLSRKWFLTKYRESYMQYKINWNLNLGVPSMGNEYKKIKEYFLRIAKAAWSLSLNENINLEITKEVCEQMKEDSLTLKEIQHINVLQEVVAQVLGYSKSDTRNEDNPLHMLIDIGAVTLDISTFNIFTDEGRLKFAIFTGKIERLGGIEIHKNRINNVKEFVNKWLLQFGKIEDPIKPIPQKISEYEPNVKQKLILAKIDKQFSDRCEIAIQENLDILRKKNPNAPQFNEIGITTFLCGGGSDIQLYKKVFDEINETAENSGTPKLKQEVMTKPSFIESNSIAEDDYHRISVAYGLSFPFEFDIDVKTPGEIGYAPTPDKVPDIRYTANDLYH